MAAGALRGREVGSKPECVWFRPPSDGPGAGGEQPIANFKPYVHSEATATGCGLLMGASGQTPLPLTSTSLP